MTKTDTINEDNVPECGKCSVCGDPAPIGACCGGYSCTKSEREQVARVHSPTVLVDRRKVLDAVTAFCEPFETGERFKKQLRNAIRAVPADASLAAPEERKRAIFDAGFAAKPSGAAREAAEEIAAEFNRSESADWIEAIIERHFPDWARRWLFRGSTGRT